MAERSIAYKDVTIRYETTPNEASPCKYIKLIDDILDSDNVNIKNLLLLLDHTYIDYNRRINIIKQHFIDTTNSIPHHYEIVNKSILLSKDSVAFNQIYNELMQVISLAIIVNDPAHMEKYKDLINRVEYHAYQFKNMLNKMKDLYTSFAEDSNRCYSTFDDKAKQDLTELSRRAIKQYALNKQIKSQQPLEELSISQIPFRQLFTTIGSYFVSFFTIDWINKNWHNNFIFEKMRDILPDTLGNVVTMPFNVFGMFIQGFAFFFICLTTLDLYRVIQVKILANDKVELNNKLNNLNANSTSKSMSYKDGLSPFNDTQPRQPTNRNMYTPTDTKQGTSSDKYGIF